MVCSIIQDDTPTVLLGLQRGVSNKEKSHTRFEILGFIYVDLQIYIDLQIFRDLLIFKIT